MHIIVLGGAGAMGRIAVRALTEYADVKLITLADYHLERAQTVASSLNSPNIDVQQVDVTNEAQLCALLRGADVALNAVDYRYNLHVLKACIAEHVHYADLGGLFHVTRKLLELHDQAAEAGITAIVGIGGTPGITNLLARAAVDQLARVESIAVQLGCSDTTPTDAPLVAPYSIYTILDEFMQEPYIFQDGTWRSVPPLSGREELYFPEPVGRATAIYTLHSECATLPLAFRDKGVQEVTFKIAFPEGFMSKIKFLVDLGLGSTVPIDVRGVSVIPRDVLARLLENFPLGTVEPQDCDVLRVVTSGEDAAGQKLTLTGQIIVLPYRRWGISAGELDTGIPLAIAGVLLGRGIISERGVHGPEKCIPLDPFFHELARYDMVAETVIEYR